MMQFNLLPYRARQRRRSRQYFYCLLLVSALFGSALAGIGWYAIGRQQEVQQARNQWLQKASIRLSAEIKQAIALQKQIDAFTADAGKIETWQRQRSRTTRFLTTLAAQIPSHAYLQKIMQQDLKITLDGYATSNLAVAELLKNLNAQSDSIVLAQLLETRARSSDVQEQEQEQKQEQEPALAFSIAITLGPYS
jgi:type IV pilus assembly protein PilN